MGLRCSCEQTVKEDQALTTTLEVTTRIAGAQGESCPGTRLLVGVALSLPVILLLACSGSPGPIMGPSPTAPTIGPVDPALVGNWSGTVDGSFGPGTFSMTLLADGSIRTSGSGNYCSFTGSWGVTSGEFKTRGPDCTGTIVTLIAPVSILLFPAHGLRAAGEAGLSPAPRSRTGWPTKEDPMIDSSQTNARPSSVLHAATAALAVAFIVATSPIASAQNGGAAATNKKALVGSWMETVTFPPESGRPPLKSLGTFQDDGTMICSDQGAISTEPPSVFTSCHGAWAHLEQRKFAYTSYELISDFGGTLVGYLKVRGVYTVSRTGNEYTGTSLAQILDTSGNVLFSVEVTNAGQRILVELP